MRSYQAPVNCQSLIFTMKTVCENSKIVSNKRLICTCYKYITCAIVKRRIVTKRANLCYLAAFSTSI